MGKKKKAQNADRPMNEDERSIIQEIDRAAEETGPVYQVVIEEAPVTLRDFLPSYRMRFRGLDTGPGDIFLNEFVQFLELNRYLALEESTGRDYAAGFARAVAAAALYMDAASIEQDEEQAKS